MMECGMVVGFVYVLYVKVICMFVVFFGRFL